MRQGLRRPWSRSFLQFRAVFGRKLVRPHLGANGNQPELRGQLDAKAMGPNEWPFCGLARQISKLQSSSVAWQLEIWLNTSCEDSSSSEKKAKKRLGELSESSFDAKEGEEEGEEGEEVGAKGISSCRLRKQKKEEKKLKKEQKKLEQGKALEAEGKRKREE